MGILDGYYESELRLPLSDMPTSKHSFYSASRAGSPFSLTKPNVAFRISRADHFRLSLHTSSEETLQIVWVPLSTFEHCFQFKEKTFETRSTFLGNDKFKK